MDDLLGLPIQGGDKHHRGGLTDPVVKTSEMNLRSTAKSLKLQGSLQFLTEAAGYDASTSINQVWYKRPAFAQKHISFFGYCQYTLVIFVPFTNPICQSPPASEHSGLHYPCFLGGSYKTSWSLTRIPRPIDFYLLAYTLFYPFEEYV